MPVTDEQAYGKRPPVSVSKPTPPPAPPRPPLAPRRPVLPAQVYTLPETPQEQKQLFAKPQFGHLLPATGKARWERFLATAPPGATPGSPEWDNWFINFYGGWQDPNDPEFSQLMQQTVKQVLGRQRKRREAEEKARKTGKSFTRLRKEERQAEEAETSRLMAAETARETRRGKRVITHVENELLGPDYQPKGAMGGQGAPVGPPQSQTEALAPGEELEGEDIGATEDGEYIWIGVDSPKREGDTTRRKEYFMSVDDAQHVLATYSPQEIAVLQQAFDLPVTGLPDKATQNKWNEAVKIAQRYTAVGKRVTIEQILAIMVNGEEAKRRSRRGGGGGGRGGGGGAGGGAGFSRSEVRAFFTQMMLDQVGREPTEAEASSFFAAFSGAGDVDPRQFATDWIRGNLTGEAGAFSAVNYYDIVMQLLAGGG